MNLSELDKKSLRDELLSLMEEVSALLEEQPDVDKFLDETDLFDDWEQVLPQAEYPIFIIAVLNNIRKNTIIDSLISSIKNKHLVLESPSEPEPLKVKARSHIGEHPFS
tara:strand:- start:1488 stop:1814 length:327 start_codon:yes stop_codon:yes gene_type:complete